jgi:hypothetical protein
MVSTIVHSSSLGFTLVVVCVLAVTWREILRIRGIRGSALGRGLTGVAWGVAAVVVALILVRFAVVTT